MKTISEKKMKRRDFLEVAGLGMLGVATAGFPKHVHG
jgi:hypothetical protein